MDIFTINIKNYKSIYFQTQVPQALAVAASFFLLQNNFYFLYGFDPGRKLTQPILLFMIVLAVIHTQYQKKRLTKLQGIEDFDERVNAYEKFYKLRLVWFLFSCVVSCVLAILTGRYFFAFFALFDFLMSLPYYPNLTLFKKELKNEELILVR